MDEEQKKWFRQYSESIGAEEFLRLGCAIMVWILIGVGISVAFELAGYSWGSMIFSIFFITMFIFPFVAHSSKLVYPFLRKILGNENLPTELMPRSRVKKSGQARPWWSYLPGLWFGLLTLLLLYLAIKYNSK